MSLYHFYILDEDGRTAAHRERLCDDDSAAVDIAPSLSGGRSVEIWTGDRCVAQLAQSHETVLRC